MLEGREVEDRGEEEPLLTVTSGVSAGSFQFPSFQISVEYWIKRV